MEPRAIEASEQDGSLLEVWVRDLSQVAPRAVGWLWPNRVPLGKVTLLAGDPGRGKSLLALDMAARVSRGASWPESGSGCAPLGRTILLSAEDDEADTIRPRFDALGGDAVIGRIGANPADRRLCVADGRKHGARARIISGRGRIVSHEAVVDGETDHT